MRCSNLDTPLCRLGKRYYERFVVMSMGTLIPELDHLFDPDSVAVVGASPDSWYSAQIVDNLLDYGFDGTLYLVNPNRDEAWGRECYDSITAVPEVVDLVVVSVPRDVTVDVVSDAGAMGIPAALVITAGFSETDETGKSLENELVSTANEHGIRICGPNSIGLADTHTETVLTSTCSRKPEPGSIGLVSQSGALAFTTFFERAADVDVHFSKIVSTGNEADLTLTDYVDYMASDPSVDAVCAYIEGLDDPRRFVEVTDRSTRNGTPVLCVKIGESEAASAATLSHTGSLTGNEDAWEAAFTQTGIERVHDIYDLLSRSRAHAAFDTPTSNRICIASTSGGMASLLADMAEDRDLDVPELGDGTETALLDMEELLTFEEIHNPIDIRGYGADVLPEISDVVFTDDNFDAYVFAIGLSAVDERASDIADDLLSVIDAANAPTFVLWTGRKTPDTLDDPQPYERVRQVTPLYYDPSRCMDLGLARSLDPASSGLT
jgi:acyl-CoA synthetase (NDP forming)